MTDHPIFRSQNVPRTPGVYVYRNALGEVIYVGKARNLRSRMCSYFRPSGAQQSDPRRRALIHSIASYEIFPVATEQEALLLESQFIKQYNPRYNVDLRDDKRFLHICIDLAESFPRLTLVRLRRDDNRLYFGPFPQANALRDTVDFLATHFRLRTCSTHSPTEQDHVHCLEHVVRNCSCPCLGNLSKETYRKQLDDVISILRGEEAAHALMEELNSRMQQQAAQMRFEEAAATRDILNNLKTVVEPTRRFRNQTISRRQSKTDMPSLEALQQALGLEKPPLTMECFDMANISGILAVGSMVCFVNGRPCTSNYRHYRIRSEDARDDTAFMREVLTRRYTRLLAEKLPLPDLIIVDGGQTQLATALQVFYEIDMPPVPVLGLAKKEELIILPGREEPLRLPREHAGLRLLQAIRDEAHRFANTYHRQLRNRRIYDSILTDIPGIGPTRRKQLLTALGSVKAIVQKTPEEIAAAVPGIGMEMATAISDFLHKRLDSTDSAEDSSQGQQTE